MIKQHLSEQKYHLAAEKILQGCVCVCVLVAGGNALQDETLMVLGILALDGSNQEQKVYS